MTPVDEYDTKLEDYDEKDDLPSPRLEAGEAMPSKEGRGKGAFGASGPMSVKQKHLAAVAAKAWADTGNVSWNEFTQSTTFHGIKYIFERSPSSHKTRKVMWIICVIAAILFFVVQVSFRVSVYLEYNTNVDVEKVYLSSAPFPAVTLCNQNNFRLTATTAKHLYHYIDAVFGGSDNKTLKDITYHTKEHIDTSEFVLEAAHQLGDLIDSCTWKGRKCNVEKDWKVRYTDMGVCYTFNSGLDGEAVKQVSEAGAALGLSLIINVEQYEYMMGPQTDAGIKILLHDQSEFPMIKDLGFAVAPGTHTLVGVNRFEVKKMEPPYGLCSQQSPSMSDCRIQCRTEEIIRRCGCRDVYMTNISNELMQMEESNCTCSVSCRSVSYEPALSYAMLSKFSVDRLVLQDPVRRTAVWDQYNRAREDFQRMDDKTSANDKEALETILERKDVLSVTLASATQELTSETLSDNIGHLYEAMYTDGMHLKEYVKEEVEDAIEHMSEPFFWYRNGLPTFWTFVQEMKNNMESSADLSAYIVDCMYAVREEEWGEENSKEQYYGPWDPDSVPASEHLQFVKKECISLPDRLHAVLELADVYTDGIGVLFSKDPIHITEHVECLQQLAPTQDDGFINKTAELSELLVEMFQHPEAPGHELMKVAEQIVELANDTQLLPMADLYVAAGDICGWVLEEQPESIKLLGDGLITIANNVLAAATTYSTFDETVFNMQDLLTSNLNATLSAVDGYLARECTKLEMSEVFGSFVSTSGLDDLKSQQMSLQSLSTKIAESFYSVEHALEVFAEETFTSLIPVLNDERLLDMEIVAFARTLGNERIDAYYANLTLDPLTFFPIITSEMMTSIREPLVSMEETVSEASVDFTNVLTAYTERMEDYAEEMTMDEGFFMEDFLQVDIFYRELNSENVVQRAAFELLSLLGEVGGFLGLLLGASILTVCELVDFLTLAFLNKWHARKQVAHS